MPAQYAVAWHEPNKEQSSLALHNNLIKELNVDQLSV